MSKLRLSSGETAALEHILKDDLSDPVSLVREIGYDPRTFFQNHDWTGMDFRNSDLTEVSFAGATVDEVVILQHQRSQIAETRPRSFSNPKVTRSRTQPNVASSDRDIFLGESQDGDAPVYHSGDSHLLTIGGAGAGKGVSAIIPNLLSLKRSAFIFDPSGQATEASLDRRKSLGKTYVIDPFSVTGIEQSSYNPLACLAQDSEHHRSNLESIADAVVFSESTDTPGQHFVEMAKLVVKALLQELSEKNDVPVKLGSLASQLSPFSHSKEDFLRRWEGREAGKMFSAMGERELSAVMTTAQRFLAFADDPAIKNATERSDFDFRRMKDEVVTVYLVMPHAHIQSSTGYIRLIVARALTDHMNSGTMREKNGPTVFFLDEFSALKKFDLFPNSLAYARKFGVQLWTFAQSISQIKQHYGNDTGSIMANVGVKQFLGVSDFETARWVSELCGVDHIGRPNVSPDKIVHMNKDEQLVLSSGQPARKLRTIRYFDQ